MQEPRRHLTRLLPVVVLEIISLILLGLAFPIACGGGSSSVGTPTPGLAAPTSLTAIGFDGQVALPWNASAGATSYHVKHGTHGGPYSQMIRELERLEKKRGGPFPETTATPKKGRPVTIKG